MTTQDPHPTLSFEDDILMVLTRDVTRTLSAPELAHAIAAESHWHNLLMPSGARLWRWLNPDAS